MKFATFDIETIPSKDLPKDLIPTFNPDDTKLGNLKDPAKILIKQDEARKEFDSKLTKKMSVDPALCQVCTFVGITYDDSSKKILNKVAVQLGLDDNDEFSVVDAAWDFIRSTYLGNIPLVSYNGIGFDLQVLLMAAIRQDIPDVRAGMYGALTKKWTGNARHYDLMLMLAGWEKNRWKKLGFYLRLFGIGSKTEGMDGSQVYPAFQAGEFKKILDYCEDDVMSTCLLFARVRHYMASSDELPEDKDNIFKA